jgi:hypothetical protein
MHLGSLFYSIKIGQEHALNYLKSPNHTYKLDNGEDNDIMALFPRLTTMPHQLDMAASPSCPMASQEFTFGLADPQRVPRAHAPEAATTVTPTTHLRGRDPRNPRRASRQCCWTSPCRRVQSDDLDEAFQRDARTYLYTSELHT